MKFCLISDLHVDHSPVDYSVFNNLSPECQTVVVAGDISNDVFRTSTEIIKLKSYFPNVIWVAGNHCMYNTGFRRTRLYDSLEWERKWPYPTNVNEIYTHYARWSHEHDIHFLHRNSVIVDGVEFVGVTGWHNFDGSVHLTQISQIDAWERYMSDSRWIEWASDTAYQAVLEAARLDADYVAQAVTANSLPKVVVSHHIPHRQFTRFTNDVVWNLLNGSFVNTYMEAVADPSVVTWCYGHTHFREDQVLNGVRYINNARGYPGENGSWQPIEVDIA
jgi:predicted phosphodiesterase